MMSSLFRKFKTWLTHPIGKCGEIQGQDFIDTDQQSFSRLRTVEAGVAYDTLYWPFDRRTIYITQAFGGSHMGLDIGIPNDTKLYNPLPVRGQITKIGWDSSGYGNMVTLVAGDWYVILAHLRRVNPDLRVGNWVETGDFLGWSDSTGNSTGPHLHLELRKRKNGYFPYPASCIDPYPYLKWAISPNPPPPPPPPPNPPPQAGWYNAIATQELFLYRKQKPEARMNWPRIASGAVVKVTNRKKIGTTQWVMLENGYFTMKKSGPTRYLRNV